MSLKTSVLTPTQNVELLGFTVETLNQTLEIPLSKRKLYC